MSVPVGQRHIAETPSNQRCYAVDACVELALHTSLICSNRKIFIPEKPETFTYSVELATTAMMEAKKANRIRIVEGGNPKLISKRLSHQENAIELLKDLKDWIPYCRRALHLRGSKVGKWYNMTENALNLVNKWHDSDVLRYRNY